jgi:hypothetical protein
MIVRLPVSGITVALLQPTGAEDLLLLERESEIRISIALAHRLARRLDGAEFDATALPVPDLERLMLELRREVLGDVITSSAKCPAPECAASVDVSFRISDYVAAQLPRIPSGVEPLDGQPGWFVLPGDGVHFRPVTGDDLANAECERQPERELARRTIRPEGAPHRLIARAQRAMQRISPCLPRQIAGRCPECGRSTSFSFHPSAFVQTELRHEAALVFEDVHILAQVYHWPEEKILALPRSRRLRYTELALWSRG